MKPSEYLVAHIDRDNPWVPGVVFKRYPRLKNTLLALIAENASLIDNAQLSAHDADT